MDLLGTVEDNRSTLSARASGSVQSLDHSLRSFCAFFLLLFAMFMTTQSNLVWNVRYLIPALPMIYLLVASSVPSFEIGFATMGLGRIVRGAGTVGEFRYVKPAASAVGSGGAGSSPVGVSAGKSGTVDLLFVAIVSVACIEFAFHFPHHFSYINPLFGGSYLVPIALNDSNFDYGQDLFYAGDWLEQHRAKSSESKYSKVFGVLSGHGCYWLDGTVEPATAEILQKAIDVRKEVDGRYRAVNTSDRKSSVELQHDMLIVSRGLFHPEPWAVGNTKLRDHQVDPDELLLVQELLSHPPDVWITPVVVVYRLSQ